MQTIQKYAIEHALYPAMELFRGNRTRRKLRRLQAGEALPLAELHARQAESLTALLLHCAAHVPAYRSLGLRREDIRADPFRCLREQVPLLTKAAFQAHPEAYLADDTALSACFENRTGGSTGEPVHFYMTRSQSEAYEAARWRGLSWYGITPGSRCAMLWGSPIELSTSRQRRFLLRERLLKNRLIFSAYQLSPETTAETVKKIERYEPEYLYGYAGALAALAGFMQQQNIAFHWQLKAVVSTAETLHTEQKKLLQQTFHCPVADEYGARDAGILAYSCPSGHLHLTAENALIEVLDPLTRAPLPDGSTGLLAVTDLTGCAQPRLRYLLGDVGALSTARCPCGRTLPLLDTIEGREDALLVGAGGKLVHGNAVGQLIRRYDQVRQFRFIQHTPQQATLLLALNTLENAPAMQIVSELQTVFPETRIELQFTDKIPPAPSGKQRYTVREFPLSPNVAEPLPR